MSLLLKFFTLLFWKDLLSTLKLTAVRFPVSLIAITLSFLLVVAEIHNIEILSGSHLETAWLLLVGVFLIFTGGNLFAERYQLTLVKKYSINTLLFLIYTIRILVKPDMDVDIAMIWASLILAISFITELKREDNNPSSWYFNFQILTAVFFSMLTGLILAGGLNLIILSIHYLFEIKINNNLYADVWSFSFILFVPSYVLTQLPTKFQYEAEDCKFPKGVYFILNFILVPLLLVYSVILYAYFVKILLQWQLPRGNLGWMISIYGVIGIITHLGLYPVRDKQKAIISWFYKAFYPMMIIPLLLLITAISVRINQYGITENRYLVVICAIWFSWLIFNNLKRKDTFQLTTVTLSLSILLLSSVFGPLSIKQLPIASQFARFESLMNKQQLLNNGSIEPAQSQPDLETARAITSVVKYLMRAKQAEYFRPYFADQVAFNKALNCQSEQPCVSRDYTALLKFMNIDPVNQWQSKPNLSSTIQLTNLPCCNKLHAKPISGFDYFVPIDLDSYTIKKNGSQTIDIKPKLTIQVDKKGELIVSSENSTITFSLLTFAEQFPLGITRIEFSEIEKLTMVQKQDNLTIKLMIENLTINRAPRKPEIQSLRGYLLIKFKESHQI